MTWNCRGENSDFPLWTRRSIRSGGSGAPHLIKQLSVSHKTEGGREGTEGKREYWRPSFHLCLESGNRGVIAKHYTKSTSNISLWWKPVTWLHKFTAKGPASPITWYGCAGRFYHIWKEDMTFRSLKCDFSNSDLPLHIFAHILFNLKAKMMQWFMWACRWESHYNKNYLELLLIYLTSNLLGLVKHMQTPKLHKKTTFSEIH